MNERATYDWKTSASKNDNWDVLGRVTIDTGTLLLIDPIHGGADVGELDKSEYAQVPISGGDFSAVLIGTGMGDGRYTVEGRYVDCRLGRRIAEIRVRFLDDDGDYLGGDSDASSQHGSSCNQSSAL
jgi:hypothetical protein